MIKEVDKLLMRLGNCVRFDLTNPLNMHIEIDSIIAYLSEYNMFVPNTAYTEMVESMLNTQVRGKIPIDVNQAFLKRQIAKALLQLASNIIWANEKQAETAHKKRIEIFGEEGTLRPVKGKTIM